MQKIEGTTIKVNRGDVLDLTFKIKQEDGSYYTFSSGEYITLSIYNKYKMNDKAIIVKKIMAMPNAKYIDIWLTSTETTIGDLINRPKEYWYEIELNDEQTVIGYDDNGPKLFILYPEGSKRL